MPEAERGVPEVRATGVADSYRALVAAQGQAIAAFPERVHQSSYRIAGHVVQLRLVGDALHRVLPRALSHLRVPGAPGNPALRIDAWDVGETGISCDACIPHEDYSLPGTTVASADGRYVAFTQAQVGSVLDRTGGHLVSWVAAASRLTQYEVGRPWQSELLLWQRDRGLQPVHAGFIEREGHGILLGGPGGSGKSTTALVCMKEGWSYLADDYVALEQCADGRFVGHGIYSSSHLEPNHLLRFESLAAGAIPGRLAREDKSLLLLSEEAGHRLRGHAPISLLALPRIVEAAATTFRPATKTEALLRLAPSSLLLLPYAGLGHQGFQAMVALVERAPTYWLELGQQLDRIPAAVSSLLEQALRP